MQILGRSIARYQQHCINLEAADKVATNHKIPRMGAKADERSPIFLALFRFLLCDFVDRINPLSLSLFFQQPARSVSLTFSEHPPKIAGEPLVLRTWRFSEQARATAGGSDYYGGSS